MACSVRFPRFLLFEIRYQEYSLSLFSVWMCRVDIMDACHLLLVFYLLVRKRERRNRFDLRSQLGGRSHANFESSIFIASANKHTHTMEEGRANKIFWKNIERMNIMARSGASERDEARKMRNVHAKPINNPV